MARKAAAGPSKARGGARTKALEHCPTGIDGLDEITNGGLPRNRTTLVAGAAGCGKTLLTTQFLLGGIDRGENGVMVVFEETAEELATNMASLGWDLQKLQDEGKLAVDFVSVPRERIDQTGEYDLEGLFVRLDLAIKTTGAQRVAIDTLEVLFSALDDTAVLRAELRRLFTWLKERGVTSIITAEKGDNPSSITRHGLEEYVSDCVITLDHRVDEQLATRRLRIVKYRGSSHGTNEYPFIIGDDGIEVVPVTSFDLEHEASNDVVSTGVPDLDEMLSKGGWYRGSTTMVSGESGTGKTSFAAAFAAAACKRGEKAVFLAFEESADQLIRNMASIGVKLQPHVRKKLLHIHASRPTQSGLESHLTELYRVVERDQPDVVVIDPITDFTSLGSSLDIKAMLMRMVDYLKTRQITTVFTSLIHEQGSVDDPTISSLIDNWVQLRNLESASERYRGIFVQKARGMAHSHSVREFELHDRGIRLLDRAKGGAA